VLLMQAYSEGTPRSSLCGVRDNVVQLKFPSTVTPPAAPGQPKCWSQRICISTAKTPKHDLTGGLHLRRDLHPLFDRGLVPVDPVTWEINVCADPEPLSRSCCIARHASACYGRSRIT
jgi:hypothetical protein